MNYSTKIFLSDISTYFLVTEYKGHHSSRTLSVMKLLITFSVDPCSTLVFIMPCFLRICALHSSLFCPFTDMVFSDISLVCWLHYSSLKLCMQLFPYLSLYYRGIIPPPLKLPWGLLHTQINYVKWNGTINSKAFIFLNSAVFNTSIDASFTFETFSTFSLLSLQKVPSVLIGQRRKLIYFFLIFTLLFLNKNLLLLWSQYLTDQATPICSHWKNVCFFKKLFVYYF